jgi:hypothetical protein
MTRKTDNTEKADPNQNLHVVIQSFRNYLEQYGSEYNVCKLLKSSEVPAYSDSRPSGVMSGTEAG